GGAGHGTEDPRLSGAARRLPLGRRAGCSPRNRSCSSRPASRTGGAVSGALDRLPLHVLPASLCVGLAASNLHRGSSPAVGATALMAGLIAFASMGPARVPLLLAALGLGG